MKYRYLLSALGFAAALSWSSAQAQFYIGGEAGWTNLEDQKVSGSFGSGTVKSDDGYNVGMRTGYMWGPWRFEEEVNYRNNDVSSIGGAAAFGRIGSLALMTNVIYDFSLGWPITPHLGAGIGAVDIKPHTGIRGSTFAVQDDEWEFGYQAIAGIRYNINPSLAFDLDYRYLATSDPTFHLTPGTAPGNNNVSAKSGYSTHNIMASLSFVFNPPPPPPPPMPAVAAPPPPARKVFLVFFDWDRDTVTPEGMAIIQQAADAFRAGAPVRIMVTGYTDRSGSPGYNQRLSERRANNVANALTRMGVPRDQMAVSGRGENDNRVPTADGVREPQNRRVEIVFP